MRVISSIGIFLLALFIVALPVPSHAQIAVGVSIRIAPPALPVYVQPACPGDGYLWTPGYWGWGTEGYYWVPGTWVRPPRVGVLWTPGYWGWSEGVYAWHAGYWGPHIGFYGGVNYGFGYVGAGYLGGEWRGGVFAYNRSVNNINVTVVHNTYNRTVINNTTVVNRVSYNGGTGGLSARPRPEEESAAREQHFQATTEQSTHEHAASTNRAQFASVNHGQPGVAATGRAGEFSGRNVVAARAAGGNRPAPAYRPGNNKSGNGSASGGGNAGGNARPLETSAPPNRGNGGGGQVRATTQTAHENAPHNNGAHNEGKPAPKEGGRGGEHEKNER